MNKASDTLISWDTDNTNNSALTYRHLFPHLTERRCGKASFSPILPSHLFLWVDLTTPSNYYCSRQLHNNWVCSEASPSHSFLTFTWSVKAKRTIDKNMNTLRSCFIVEISIVIIIETLIIELCGPDTVFSCLLLKLIWQSVLFKDA